MYVSMLPPGIEGMIPKLCTCSTRHRKERGNRINLRSYSSCSWRPSTSGIVLAIAPIKEVLDLDIFNCSLLFTLRSKHIVRWKITDEIPKAKPNRGTCTRNACMTLTVFRLVTISVTSLKSAVWKKVRQNGSEDFYMHTSHESRSQQQFPSCV